MRIFSSPYQCVLIGSGVHPAASKISSVGGLMIDQRDGQSTNSILISTVISDEAIFMYFIVLASSYTMRYNAKLQNTNQLNVKSLVKIGMCVIFRELHHLTIY